jgi:hypothetical protein
MVEGVSPVRARVLIAAGALLAVIVAAILITRAAGGDQQSQARPAPPECLRAWNSDPAALSFGRHNYRNDAHRYDSALVTYLDNAAQVAGPKKGGCAVVFASPALDPEPFAAGEVLRGGAWLPISALNGVDLLRVAELQATAAAGPNATLASDGRLTAR